MVVNWNIAFDCGEPGKLAEFWALAVGYVPAPPPQGFASWDDWYRHFNVPEDEIDSGAYLVDPEGVRPKMSFLRVPEGKTAKNRLHIDIPIGGGRHVPIEERWPRVLAHVDKLTSAGATVVEQYDHDGQPDHMLMTDPEGNEFCVV
ncbi:VOC family protein [Kibdelosporangium philippinense]|uniref:VOC family protein n=1 Tax=Kibdelosporangium philippinense TaxID=211113 RepID=A0ABS8ZUB4_9PSEU|nr:VOC family protein [Kibdelosporangium philippinense]MCE7011329.1 VOC family protein [Kibdelosporangium philippinense]